MPTVLEIRRWNVIVYWLQTDLFCIVVLRLEKIPEGKSVPRATSDTTRRLRSEVNSSYCWPYICFNVILDNLEVYQDILCGLRFSLAKVEFGNSSIPKSVSLTSNVTPNILIFHFNRPSNILFFCS